MADDKGSFYFSHDCNARNDRKMIKVRMKFGWEGYGLYFAIIEVMREQADFKLKLSDVDGLAYEFKTSSDFLMEFIAFAMSDNVRLFNSDGESFWSDSFLRRMLKMERQRKAKSKGGSKAMANRWKQDKEAEHANLRQPQAEKKQKAKKEPRVTYAENVAMREKDYQTLVNKYGIEAATEMIEILDNYKGAKAGRTYKDDYRAILSWVVNEYFNRQKATINGNGKTTNDNWIRSKVELRKKLEDEFLSS
jgi:hypothetical protein